MKTKVAPKAAPKVAVVIPNWNAEEFIGKCLDSLAKQTYRPQVIVVDNGSTDKSREIIRKHIDKDKKIEMLEFDDNAGFAGGVNRGLRPNLDKYDYIALFNNDAIADKDWLKHLVEAAEEHKDAGIVTGKLMRADKKHIDSTGDFYTMWGMPFPRGRNEIDSGQFDQPEYVFGASGGASLYRTKALKEIGLFDEDFFAYFEDVDISMRAQIAGWKVYYTPKAEAYHHVGGTSSKMGDLARFHSIKNYYLVIDRNLPWQLGLLYLPFILLQSARLLLTSLIKNRNLVYFKALGKAIQLAPKTLKIRKQRLKGRKISIGQLNGLIEKRVPPVTKRLQ